MMTMIDNSTIFSKSEKGKEILNNSSRELSRAERQILIFVDGKKTASELISQITIFKNVSAILESLFKKGLIQASRVNNSLKSNTSRPTNTVREQTDRQTYELTEHNLKVLENALIEFLGPMGRFILSDILKNASTFDTVNTAILNEIDQKKHDRYREIIGAELE